MRKIILLQMGGMMKVKCSTVVRFYSSQLALFSYAELANGDMVKGVDAKGLVIGTLVNYCIAHGRIGTVKSFCTRRPKFVAMASTPHVLRSLFSVHPSLYRVVSDAGVNYIAAADFNAALQSWRALMKMENPDDYLPGVEWNPDSLERICNSDELVLPGDVMI